MTDEQTRNISNFLWQRIGIWAVGGALWTLTLVAATVLTPIGDRLVAIWDSPDRLASIDSKLDMLVDDIRRATGEDRVIRQTPGLSYVTEPVFEGEAITLNLVAERTTLGQECRLVGNQSLFTDATNVTTPGRRAQEGAIRQQIGTSATRLRVNLIPPPNLQPGRVELYLALEYDCNGRAVFDRTDAVVFELLAGPRPD